MTKLLLLLALSLALLASQCQGEDNLVVRPLDYLPAPSHSGEGIVGCLVNGEARVTRTSDARAVYGVNYLQISAEFGLDSSEQSIGINVRSEPTINTEFRYDLTGDGNNADFYTQGFSMSTCYYEENRILSGSTTITYLDGVDRIVAGTFEFTSAVEGCDTIRVTDGRFDISY